MPSPPIQGRQGSPDRARFRLLHKALKAFARFRAGAGGFAAFATLHGGAKARIAAVQVHTQFLGGDDAVGVLRAKPHEPPFHFQMLVVHGDILPGGLVFDVTRQPDQVRFRVEYRIPPRISGCDGSAGHSR
jgi:hypothetical protein